MEKGPSFGKKVLKYINIAGVSALSLLLSSEKLKAQDEVSKYQYTTSQELKNEETLFNLAWAVLYEDISENKAHEKFNKWYASIYDKDLDFLKKLQIVPLTNPNISREDLRAEIWKKKLDELYNTSFKNIEIPNWHETLLPRVKVQEKIDEIKKIIECYEIGRQWVLDNINNPEYIERSATENRATFSDLPENKVKEYINKKIVFQKQRVSKGNFTLVKSGDNPVFRWNNIFFPLYTDSVDAVRSSIHEWIHALEEDSTLTRDRGDRVSRILLNAPDSLSIVENLNGQFDKDISRNLRYFSNPGEIRARKKLLDYDLERLGVKRYGEEFNMEHYQKAIKLREEGKLSQDASEFLYIVTDPKKVVRIMNKIADSGSNKKNKHIVFPDGSSYSVDEEGLA